MDVIVVLFVLFGGPTINVLYPVEVVAFTDEMGVGNTET